MLGEWAREEEDRDPFPGCNNRIDLDRHHEGGWREVGHDPDRCLRLCVKHHRARHRKEIIIEGSYPSFVFRLADGTLVEAPDDPTSPSLELARTAVEPSASRETLTGAGGEASASREAARVGPREMGASHEAATSGAAAAASREALTGAGGERGASREARASQEAAVSRREIDETVAAALVKLELKPREARAAIRRARERMPVPAEDVATLLAAALRYAGTG